MCGNIAFFTPPNKVTPICFWHFLPCPAPFYLENKTMAYEFLFLSGGKKKKINSKPTFVSEHNPPEVNDLEFYVYCTYFFYYYIPIKKNKIHIWIIIFILLCIHTYPFFSKNKTKTNTHLYIQTTNLSLEIFM